MTPLYDAMRPYTDSRRLAATNLLLEHGVTDIIEADVCGQIVKFSLALEEIHRSLVNSPYYIGSTLLGKRIVESFDGAPETNRLAPLLSEYGGCLDPVFLRPDRLVDSFVAEFMEHCWNGRSGSTAICLDTWS
ncbi:hypothetical protein M422DRAFT_257452 [Sphaerobolus stellatus SS14]|uniref:Uncharacterized protein n=1 Tax=Sphaerobolus stellatus (strain SS14) TaxID=990650 RepID=A0A0C9U9T1_SPHS4|nr:hypothetical protein M422DRAFT_257452 [Sphaerobolus stellatus SS14]